VSASRRPLREIAAALALAALAVAGCGASASRSDGKKSIVVTYSVMGAVVKDLVGDAADVTVLMPNGADPHQWAPSARDIEALVHADLLVENGLNLEGGMGSAFGQAESAGVHRFVASDHITVRKVGTGEGIPGGGSDQAAGASDPHLWMDPLTMRDVVTALATQIRADVGLDLSARAVDLEKRLDELNTELTATLSVVPQALRKLVTGHESLGYFADRYGFTLIGAIVPSLSDQAETSSADLATLEARIKSSGVKAIFTELGTSAATADAVGRDTGAKVVELSTHVLPSDGSYSSFMRAIASAVASNLV
jgi:zinc/manganese transport system substrate-binding protein